MATGKVPQQPIETAAIDGLQMEIFSNGVELPADEARRAICMEHISARVGAMLDEFRVIGCYTEVQTNNTDTHLRLSCKGLTRFGRQCRLTMTQQDDAGNELVTATWSD